MQKPYSKIVKRGQWQIQRDIIAVYSSPEIALECGTEAAIVRRNRAADSAVKYEPFCCSDTEADGT